MDLEIGGALRQHNGEVLVFFGYSENQYLKQGLYFFLANNSYKIIIDSTEITNMNRAFIMQRRELRSNACVHKRCWV